LCRLNERQKDQREWKGKDEERKPTPALLHVGLVSLANDQFDFEEWLAL
jgi:hypothetical protein